jgi:glutamyl-tRNA synthetase
MSWLGLTWDEGPFYQAERVSLYKKKIEQLLNEGKAYRCTCSPEELEAKRKQALAEKRKPKYDGTCRTKGLRPQPGSVVRFRVPDSGTTVVDDLIKGKIIFENSELDDLIIERADGYPTYNLAVVIDDAEMSITHIIRGDDHVNNTPKQILLYQALGYDVPEFAHVPMILGADRARLSKRHGAESVLAYRDMGYLPEALVNYLVRLGWSHGDQEIFSMEELIRFFSLKSVGKSAAIFNPEKLLWLNQQYIKNTENDKLAQALEPILESRGIPKPDFGFLKKVTSDLQARAKTLIEMADSASFYFTDTIEYDVALAEQYFNTEGAGYLNLLLEQLPQLQDYSKEGIEALLKKIAEENGAKLKNVVQPIRVALTGKTVSPGIDEVMITLGKERVIKRIKNALDYLNSW